MHCELRAEMRMPASHHATLLSADGYREAVGAERAAEQTLALCLEHMEEV